MPAVAAAASRANRSTSANWVETRRRPLASVHVREFAFGQEPGEPLLLVRESLQHGVRPFKEPSILGAADVEPGPHGPSPNPPHGHDPPVVVVVPPLDPPAEPLPVPPEPAAEPPPTPAVDPLPEEPVEPGTYVEPPDAPFETPATTITVGESMMTRRSTLRMTLRCGRWLAVAPARRSTVWGRWRAQRRSSRTSRLRDPCEDPDRALGPARLPAARCSRHRAQSSRTATTSPSCSFGRSSAVSSS